jgi:hypothetical protein
VKPLYVPDGSFHCPCKSCLIPSNESCSDYYLCLGFTAYHLKCSSNLLFDRDLNTCNHAIMVRCFQSTTVTVVTSTTASTRKSTLSSTTRTTTTKRPQISSTTAKPRRFVCPTRNGLFKNPTNCGKFIQCSNGIPYEMQCPPTTHFSVKTNRCEYPCDAKCDLSLCKYEMLIKLCIVSYQ